MYAIRSYYDTGQVLRLRNRGVLDQATKARGHQMVKLSVVLPKDDEPELRAFLERWQPEHAQNPREEFLR